MLRDINLILDYRSGSEIFTVIFGQFLQVDFDSSGNVIYTIRWTKFWNLYKVNNNYHMSFVYNDVTVSVYTCNYQDSEDIVLGRIEAILNLL